MSDFDNNINPAEPQQPEYQAPQPEYQAPQPEYQAPQPEYQAPQPDAPVGGRLPSRSKEKLVAGLLALFLGTLGIHKFYLGYTKAGVIMLLVSVIGSVLFGAGPAVMAVIALIEAIMYLTKSDDDFDRIYVLGTKEWF